MTDTCTYPTDGEDKALYCWPIPTALLLTLLTVGVASLGGVAGVLLSSASISRNWSAQSTAIVAGGVMVAAYLLIALALQGAARNSDTGLWAAVGMRSAPLAPVVSAGLAVGLGMRAVTATYGIALQRFGLGGRGAPDPTKLLPTNLAGVALTVIVTCVVAPVVEEMVFRGVLLTAFARRLGVVGGVLVSSVAFAMAHASWYAAPPIFLLSLVLGRLFVRTGTLWQPIAAHAAFNAIGIVALYAFRAAGQA